MPPATISPSKVLLANSPVPYRVLRSKPPYLDMDGSGWKSGLSVAVGKIAGGTAADVYRFGEWAAGLQYTISLGGGLTATRYIPLSDPFVGKLLCTSLHAEYTGDFDAGNADPIKQWSSGKVDLNFSAVPYATDGSAPFMNVEFESGVEVYTIGGMQYAFGSGEQVQADAGVHVPISVYSITQFNCPDDGSALVQPLLGKLNNATFLGCATGTVRCDGFSARITMLGSGQTTYERSLKLSWRPIHWNYFLSRAAAWGVVTDPGGGTVYGTADFSPLLR